MSQGEEATTAKAPSPVELSHAPGALYFKDFAMVVSQYGVRVLGSSTPSVGRDLLLTTVDLPKVKTWIAKNFGS